jgi:hypothetical protein
VFQGEEGEPLDGRDKSIVYQVAVSFPEAWVEGVSRICLMSGYRIDVVWVHFKFSSFPD